MLLLFIVLFGTVNVSDIPADPLNDARKSPEKANVKSEGRIEKEIRETLNQVYEILLKRLEARQPDGKPPSYPPGWASRHRDDAFHPGAMIGRREMQKRMSGLHENLERDLAMTRLQHVLLRRLAEHPDLSRKLIREDRKELEKQSKEPDQTRESLQHIEKRIAMIDRLEGLLTFAERHPDAAILPATRIFGEGRKSAMDRKNPPDSPAEKCSEETRNSNEISELKERVARLEMELRRMREILESLQPSRSGTAGKKTIPEDR